MKALQIFLELRKLHPDTLQITHARNRSELQLVLGSDGIYYVEDDFVAKFFWRSIVFRQMVDWWFSRCAVKLADTIASTQRPGEKVIVHQTEPNSPVIPRTVSRKHLNVFGPINGNLYYPEIYRNLERTSVKFRRFFHLPLQKLNRALQTGLTQADLILAAGGDRTVESLLAAGCRKEVIVETLDCGLPDEMLDRPWRQQSGINCRFVHFGRLVLHKGTALAIESLTRCGDEITLDVIGQGPELQQCKVIAEQKGLLGRVRFLDWYKDRSELLEKLPSYRGMVLPTMEDANGIVVQESMALGIIPICLDWGGPTLLIDHARTGFLVTPTSQEDVLNGLAKYMEQISKDSALAEAISTAARKSAESWRWSVLIEDWMGRYEKLVSQVNN